LGSSPQILVSGWYDGQVRCYDLRSSSRVSAATNSDQTPAPLLPVLSLFDPLSVEPIYSISCGGGSSSHIAAGSARHGVISFWDLRFPRAGWSVYAPGNDPSPVYSVILESSRIYGATQSRPFVYDFVSLLFRQPASCLLNLFPGSRHYCQHLPKFTPWSWC
jgi:WD40 repeat protein